MLELYGKEIPLKTHFCSLNGKERHKIDYQYVSLYVKFRGCNARCEFCEFIDDAYDFDYEKYCEILEYVKSKININRLNLTGGEPTLNYDKFIKVFNLTKERISGYTTFTINTNGINLDKLMTNYDIYDRCEISMSRHHYDDKKNDEIFKSKMIEVSDVKNIYSKIKDNVRDKTFNFTCNLVKGYIDNEDDIYKYLEHADDVGIDIVGFVSLMPVNDFCADNFINFNKIKGDRIIRTKQWKNEDSCVCNNYLYLTEKGNVIRIYYKNTYKPDSTYPMLVFDGKNLRVGFGGEVLV